MWGLRTWYPAITICTMKHSETDVSRCLKTNQQVPAVTVYECIYYLL